MTGTGEPIDLDPASPSDWRPPPRVRVKAVGLHWRDRRLLATEVRDATGRLKGVCPLGGGVEFGERWPEALVREFREELGVEVTVTGPPIVLENIYVHNGARGHEIVFVAEVALPPGAFAGEDHIRFTEGNGTPCIARWYDPAELDCDGGPRLFPDGLKALLPRVSGPR
jgi:ADP-ribose pyrophosphatase YjhB (NUDIX family)